MTSTQMRDHAARCRYIATIVSEPTREIFLDLADRWDAMANGKDSRNDLARSARDDLDRSGSRHGRSL